MGLARRIVAVRGRAAAVTGSARAAQAGRAARAQRRPQLQTRAQHHAVSVHFYLLKVEIRVS